MSVSADVKAMNIPDVFAYPEAAGEMTAEKFDSRRQAIRELLEREEYGKIPAAPDKLEFTEKYRPDVFCGGHADYYVLDVTSTIGSEKFTFPLRCMIPHADKPVPAFVLINFRPEVPDTYLPVEEVCDNGFAVFSFCYNEVTRDNGDFTDGIAPIFTKGERGAEAPGKLSMWAWAAERVMDYLQTLDCIDKKNIAVTGHSRLGKAALWTAANDERFAFCMANESGCGGASLSRNHIPESERIHNIMTSFPYWFCPNFAKYAYKEDELPFDQHFLLALIAPRGLAIGSADGDLWTDPVAQYRACTAVSKVYELYGKAPFDGPDTYPLAGETYNDALIGYHMRDGLHFYNRYDWQQYMAFFKKHMN